MSNLYQTDLVKYECSCGLFCPLSELYVCRHCVLLKCVTCAYQHNDGCFCRACFENVALTEARHHKNLCASCYKCPVCEMVLTSRSINDKTRLACTNCKYTTIDAGYEDSENQQWSSPALLNESFFGDIKTKLKELSHYEKMEIDKNEKRRRSNMLFVSDKYGMQSILSRKKLEANPQPSPMVGMAIQDADVEEISLEEIMKPIDPNSVPKYEQQLSCLENNKAPLYPSNLHLVSRRSLRCNVSDHGLVRSEYNPTAVNFRVKAFANQYLPDIKIARPVKLMGKAEWPLFLSISNHTAVPVKIRIQPIPMDEDDLYVMCQSPPVECTIHPPNAIADINDQLQENDINRPNNCVVFKKRHRAGVHLTIQSKKVQQYNYLLLAYSYEFEGNPFPVSDQPIVNPQNTRVRLNLGPSVAGNAA